MGKLSNLFDPCGKLPTNDMLLSTAKVENNNLVASVCPFGWVCGTYVVHPFVGTGLHCAPSTGLHCAPMTCVVHYGAQGGPTTEKKRART